MKNEKNITGMKQHLQALGFGDGLEKLLRASACFRPASFALPYVMRVSGDVVSFRMHAEKNDKGEYLLCHYDATLRKKIEVAEGAGELDIDIAALEKKMAEIDWAFVTAHTDAIEAIVAELDSLADIGADGVRIAGLLKFKYWSDTPAEPMVPGLAVFKNQYEISQRFYISEGQGITTEEAYRFLCSKWIEKKMSARKKQETKHGRV